MLPNVIGIVAEFILLGFSAGMDYIQTIYSPFNVMNLIVTLVSLAPGLLAIWWRNKRGERQSGTSAAA